MRACITLQLNCIPLLHRPAFTGSARPRRAGAVVGQAATFSEYRLEDGTVVKFAQGGKGVPLPSAEDIEAAERAVAEQSEAVRKLKETEGKANSDPDVKVICSMVLCGLLL